MGSGWGDRCPAANGGACPVPSGAAGSGLAGLGRGGRHQLLQGGLARGVPALAPVPGQCSGRSVLASVSGVWGPPQTMTGS